MVSTSLRVPGNGGSASANTGSANATIDLIAADVLDSRRNTCRLITDGRMVTA